jgi:hypothetical protein
LKLIKKLVQNSLDYSALKGENLDHCTNILTHKWNNYMKTFAQF